MTQLIFPAPVTELIAELQANCDRDFADARAMPPAVYTSPQFLELEKEHLFRTQCCAWAAPAACRRPAIT